MVTVTGGVRRMYFDCKVSKECPSRAFIFTTDDRREHYVFTSLIPHEHGSLMGEKCRVEFINGEGTRRDLLVLGGYYYIKEKDGAKGKTLWRCSQYTTSIKCLARCHSIGDEAVVTIGHSHDPDFEMIQKLKENRANPKLRKRRINKCVVMEDM